MSYTINPNAKNKWARNAENTMDLSLETDASSVYLDNGRTLEQEIGEGSMVSNIATVDSSVNKVIDGTLDGAYESLVFKGKSLVNVIGKITVSNNAIDNRDGSYTINKNTAYSRINIFGGNPMIKANTPYYFTVIVSNGTLTNLNVDVGTSVTKQQLGSGKYLITLTEESFNIAANRLFWYQSSSTTSEETVTVYPILIEYQQGMENLDIPYFEGITSVKMPVLKSVGKNLLNPSWKKEYGKFYPFKLKKGTTLTLSTKDSVPSLGGNLLFTTISGGEKWFSINAGATKNTITLYEDVYQVNNLLEGDIEYQLELGSIATLYEPYKTNILRTSEEIVLREVNGIQDTYNPLTGEYVRRIGEKVFDGSQTIAFSGGDHNTVVQFYYTDTTVAKTNDGSIVKVLCNNFPTYAPNDVIGKEVEGVTSRRGDNQGFYFSISKTKIASRDTVLIKNYLQQNPITVQYELAEPITTIIEPLTIPFAYENGHIILESGFEGQSLLPTLEYSTVVNKTGQIESVAKTIQRQEKQLTMLEQMLIQNIINLDYNNTLLTLKNEMEEMF